MKKWHVVLIFLLWAPVALAVWQSYRTQQSLLAAIQNNPILNRQPRPAPPPITLKSLDLKGAPQIGSEMTNVVLLELSDYQCPYCRRFFNDTLSRIRQDYISNGKIRYAFLDLPNDRIHPLAMPAAEAAHCAGEQGQFWKLHDELFKAPLNDLSDIARASKVLDARSIDSCRSKNKYRTVIAESRDALSKGGFNGTPSFAVGILSGTQLDIKRTLVGARPYSDFQKEIDDVLKMASSR